eukprot:gnl/Trimastix_PCT/908.p1 GENE.gnl/Trimastix_PCT/908~~gnl/Trimastix_PCT/908.p1  ORF type:complete len:540 (-),score=180.37 gnl/Trimastix_PCT/908:479-2098(-)
MSKVIECVPNFSEGRDPQIIKALVKAVKKVPGVTILDYDPGKSTNRTVLTFIGDPMAVVEGALALCAQALNLIDMSKHSGEHPRIGAVDVVPFIPVVNATMEDCIDCANNFGRRASEKLGIPIYLYGDAAKADYRRLLPQIRQGDYEALESRITQDEWKPDFGPAQFLPHYGATCTGARFFLIPYNINILSTKEHAHRIALDLREAGRGPGTEGLLPQVQGIGWYVNEYNMAQVSLNLRNFNVTGLHGSYEACKRVAAELNIAVAGSEIVGVVPLQALLEAAHYYMAQENLMICDERQKVRLAIERLGLNSVSRFDPDARVVEYILAKQGKEALAGMTVRSFVEEVASRSPAPGGGSVSALVAGLGSGLGAMMGWLSYGKRQFEPIDAQMRAALPKLHETTQRMIRMIDADTESFNRFMAAGKIADPEEKKRQQTLALKEAAETPLRTMEQAHECWDAMDLVAEHGNINSLSDAHIGARCLELGIWGAFKNVEINLKELAQDPSEQEWVAAIRARANAVLAQAHERRVKVDRICDGRNQ